MNKNQFFIFLLTCICVFLSPNALFANNIVNPEFNSLMQSGNCENPAALNFGTSCLPELANDGCCVFAGCLSPAYLEYYTQGFVADVPCTVEDPSCTSPCLVEMVPGCLDENACSFNPDANWSFRKLIVFL